jgi:hypothetical protein
MCTERERARQSSFAARADPVHGPRRYSQEIFTRELKTRRGGVRQVDGLEERRETRPLCGALLMRLLRS